MEDVKEPCENSSKDMANSSSSKDRSMTLPEEAFNNFLQGKRHMLVQDYSFAVQSLATACEMYVKHYGELAIECGEVYFLYGKALFRLSQQQAGVLGGAMNEGSNEDENSSESEGKENEENESEKNSDAEEGEGNEETEQDGEKEEKEPSESTDSPPAVLDEGSVEGKVKEASKSVDEAGPSQPEQSIKSEPGESEPGDQGTEENKTEDSGEETQEPEEDDLELAWNTLETAKSIFKRLDTVEAELKVAEILQLLAEISMESDNNPAAINDLKESLKIQEKHLKPDDRILAETYYQMGLAQMLEKVYPEALENFRTTKQILELRRENLKNTVVDDADGTFKSADIQAEIADLDTILVDIQEKIEDTLELITNKEKELNESKALESVSVAGSSSIPVKELPEKSTASKPVSNITHLLKRKKPEDASSEDSAKRIKTANVPNGESKISESETKAAEL